MPSAGRGRNQLANNCFIHTAPVGGQSSARHLVGRIDHQGTEGRGGPPPCLNGFDCARTPFACGHIMALDLGGPDISENIVPQYGQWQGVGDWRRMEREVRSAGTDADVFIADIEYQPGPFVETYQQQYDRFSNGDNLFHWQHECIPLRFRVWTVAANWSAGTARIEEYLNGDDAYKDSTIGNLIAALPDARRVFEATINEVPQIDRDYWRGQMVKSFVRNEHERYEGRMASRNRLIAAQNQQAKNQHKQAVEAITGVRPRIPVKQRYSAIAAIPKPLILPQRPSFAMAEWLRDDNVATGLVQRIVDSQDASKGWTPIEKATFTPQQLRGAVMLVGSG